MQQSWLSTASLILNMDTFQVLFLVLWRRRTLLAPSRRWTLGWLTLFGSVLVGQLTLLNVLAQQPSRWRITRIGVPIFTIAIVVVTGILLMRAWWKRSRHRER